MSAMTDQEQLDTAKSFFKKYGSAMISGVLIALIAFFGWGYWQKKSQAENQIETAKVQALVDEASAANNDPKILAVVSSSAEKIVKDNPDSVQALQAQFLMAKVAYDQQDYVRAERELKKLKIPRLLMTG